MLVEGVSKIFQSHALLSNFTVEFKDIAIIPLKRLPAAPPTKVDKSISPYKRSFPVSNKNGKRVNICWELKANNKIFYDKWNNYGNYTKITEENYNAFPISHPNILLRKFSFEDMNNFISVLQDLDSMSCKN